MPTNGQFAVGELVTSADANTLFVRGYGNRIINGNFEINQRFYASGTNLASGSYGFDRWKSGFTNTALTFTDGVQNTTVTISSSGVIQQIIERENMPAGTYILSWSGTATGRVYNSGGTPPSYAASPITVTLDGSANVVVEFTASGGTRTLGLVQLEAGTVFSPFQYRHRGEEFALCQRYFQRLVQPPLRGVCSTAFARMGCTFFPMRSAPTISGNGGTMGFYDGATAVIGAVVIGVSYNFSNCGIEIDITSSGWTTGRAAVLYQVNTATLNIDLNAEL
jgi:hypothetical protein